ncbi:hypothetical protein CPB86DRAFT_398680 [Serendipita vermifera]|nr:hypothetical protein CPB86DRAFT_398680 [Serendipita vermifera]
MGTTLCTAAILCHKLACGTRGSGSRIVRLSLYRRGLSSLTSLQHSLIHRKHISPSIQMHSNGLSPPIDCHNHALSVIIMPIEGTDQPLHGEPATRKL